jgi:hypothetical protein
VPRGSSATPWSQGGGRNHPNGGLGVAEGAQEKKQREKQEMKKQTARFFSYIHQYHHYKNPKPKTLMVRCLLSPSGLCISLSLELLHHACTVFATEFQRLVSIAEFHRNSLTIGGWLPCPNFVSLFFLKKKKIIFLIFF